MKMPAFDYEHAFVLSGTLTTQHATALQAQLAQAFPEAPDDEERECIVTFLHDTVVQIHVRYDALIREDAVIHHVLAAAPDAQGTLTLQWPYTEIQEHILPVDLRFSPNHVAIFDYVLQPATTPRTLLDPGHKVP